MTNEKKPKKVISIQSNDTQLVGNFKILMSFNQILECKKLNKAQVKVLRFQKIGLIPLWITKRQHWLFTPNLLLNDGQPDFYVSMKDLKFSDSILKQQLQQSISQVCRNCFHICHVCHTVENYEGTFETCMQKEAASNKLPDETKNDPAFQKNQSR